MRVSAGDGLLDIGQPVISLDTLVRGVCEPERLLDLVENFTVFQEMRGGLVKMVAKNHQFLGVNNAIEALRDIEGRAGRLGVFWHTQGSGKSLSMLFFAQKVLRKLRGNWTFVIVTDRRELDDQIYGTFQDTGAVKSRGWFLPRKTNGSDQTGLSIVHPSHKSAMRRWRTRNDANLEVASEQAFRAFRLVS